MSASLNPSALVPRRLTVPAVRTDAREKLIATVPFFLRAPGAPPAALPVKQVSPPLLAFEGDTFMDDFLAAVADRSKLPPQLAWRDWSEPPAGVLDTQGHPLYPATIVRAAPLTIAPENELPNTLDADGVPHASPAWLRKLYLPLHLRFHFVAFDVVCLRSGFPRLDKPRVLAAGAVVRRLVRDPTGERWDDWLTADDKTGLWFELHDGLPTDPDAIPSPAFRDRLGVSQEAAIAARLGVSGPLPLKLGLDSTNLTLLPPTAGNAADHCAVYGLLPVYSAAQQANDDTPGMTEAQLAAAFQAQATATLTSAWADDAGLRAVLGPALGQLLDLTVLPVQLPGPAGDVALALNRLRTAAHAADPFYTPSDAELRALVPNVAKVATLRHRAASIPTAATIGNAADASPAQTATDFWNSRGIGLACQDAVFPADGRTALEMAALNSTKSSNPANWNVLTVDYLRRTAASALTTTGAPSGDLALGQALLALAMIRLRRMRLALLNVLHAQAFGQDDSAALTSIRVQTLDGVPYNVPAGTAGGLSGEIEAMLGLDAVRTPAPSAPSWPPFILAGAANQLALAAHRAGLAVEEILAPVDAAGAGAGSAYESMMETKTGTVATTLATWFGLPLTPAGVPPRPANPLYRLLEAGLELREQPSRGLLLFPGPAPAATAFAAATTSIAASYAPGTALTKAETKGHARVHRPRYDHDSLYAVWAWVRVAGRDDCENEQIVWTERSEPFQIAEPTDILGAKPVTIQLPDLAKLIRDIPRIAKARAKPFAAFNTPPNSGYNVGDDPKDTSRTWGVGWICSFAIPVITICAFILFSIIFSILIVLPGFAWMLLLKFCIPIPVPKKS